MARSPCGHGFGNLLDRCLSFSRRMKLLYDTSVLYHMHNVDYEIPGHGFKAYVVIMGPTSRSNKR